LGIFPDFWHTGRAHVVRIHLFLLQGLDQLEKAKAQEHFFVRIVVLIIVKHYQELFFQLFSQGCREAGLSTQSVDAAFRPID
jgi:hypothetical protein